MTPSLLARMEAAINWIQGQNRTGHNPHVDTLTEALAALRSQEATVRECAETALREFESADHGCRISDAILARFGLKGEKSA